MFLIRIQFYKKGIIIKFYFWVYVIVWDYGNIENCARGYILGRCYWLFWGGGGGEELEEGKGKFVVR